MSPFICGIIGAFFAQGLRIVELEKLPRDQRPDNFTDPLYWFQFFFWIAAGGGLAALYGNSNIVLSPVLALNIGISAPLLAKQMASSIPSLTPKKTD